MATGAVSNEAVVRVKRGYRTKAECRLIVEEVVVLDAMSGNPSDTQTVSGRALFSDVMPGEYPVRLVRAGFRTQEVSIKIIKGPFEVRVGMPPKFGNEAPPGSDNLAIRGRLKCPIDSIGCWIKIHGVFLHAIRQSSVDPDGSFTVRGLDTGTYVVEAFHGSVLQHPLSNQSRVVKTNPALLFSRVGKIFERGMNVRRRMSRPVRGMDMPT